MKNMKRYIIPLFVFLQIMIFTACEDVIDVKVSDENLNLYAVEAKITTESAPYVFLYKTLRVDESTSYPGVSGATVTISDNSEPQKSIRLEESTENQGLYLAPETFLGETGKEYTVTIEHNGITITGSDVLSSVEPIDSIQVHPSLRGDEEFLGIFIYGDEPEGEGNYYKWDIYIDGVLLNDAEDLSVASDELVDGNYVSSLEIFTDYHDDDEDPELNAGSTVMVKQNSISEFAYKYYYQLYDQSTTGGLFSVPPANIESNFTASDGSTVLGLFTAQDVSASNTVPIDEQLVSQLK
jgi:hypothetical protein